MALTLVLGKLSPEAMQGLMKEGLAARERYFRDLADSVGMKVHGYYFAEGGEWDLVVLLEAEAEGGADTLATTFATQATGMYTSFRTLRLYAPADVDAGFANAVRLRAPGS
jgi:uncharacterized protein with GYD domain